MLQLTNLLICIDSKTKAVLYLYIFFFKKQKCYFNHSSANSFVSNHICARSVWKDHQIMNLRMLFFHLRLCFCDKCFHPESLQMKSRYVLWILLLFFRSKCTLCIIFNAVLFLWIKIYWIYWLKINFLASCFIPYSTNCECISTI